MNGPFEEAGRKIDIAMRGVLAPFIDFTMRIYNIMNILDGAFERMGEEVEC